MSLNKIMLIGNVGKDPEVKHFEDNRTMVTFTLATTERYTDREGNRKENTEWHNIVLWGKQAEVAEKYVKKGSQIYVEGKSTTRSWTDQDGAKKFVTEVKADTFQLLGGRADPNLAGARQMASDLSPAPAAAPQGFSQKPNSEFDTAARWESKPDDLPF